MYGYWALFFYYYSLFRESVSRLLSTIISNNNKKNCRIKLISPMNAQKILIRYLHYRGELGKGLSRSEVTWGPLSGKKKKKKKKALAE